MLTRLGPAGRGVVAGGIVPAPFRGRWLVLVLAPVMTLCHGACPLTTAVLTALVRALRYLDIDRCALAP